MKKNIQQVAATFGSTSRIGAAVFLDAPWREISAFLRKAERMGVEWEFLFHCGTSSWVRIPDHLEGVK